MEIVPTLTMQRAAFAISSVEKARQVGAEMTNNLANEAETIDVEFDWLVYSDATLAGLSALIPLPYFDSALERYFRLRMLRTIAKRRDVTLHPKANRIINHTRLGLWSRVTGLLRWPVELTVDLAVRFSRKVLYFLTAKKAVDALSYYWQRAYLLDYMVRQGYASNSTELDSAARALEQVLSTHVDSPLTVLAKQVIGASSGVLNSLRRWKLHRFTPTAIQPLQIMEDQWEDYQDYFVFLRQEYERAFENELVRSRPA